MSTPSQPPTLEAVDRALDQIAAEIVDICTTGNAYPGAPPGIKPEAVRTLSAAGSFLLAYRAEFASKPPPPN